MATKKLSTKTSELSAEADKPLGMVFSTDTPCGTKKSDNSRNGMVHVVSDLTQEGIKDADVYDLDNCKPGYAVLAGACVAETFQENYIINY